MLVCLVHPKETLAERTDKGTTYLDVESTSCMVAPGQNGRIGRRSPRCTCSLHFCPPRGMQPLPQALATIQPDILSHWGQRLMDVRPGVKFKNSLQKFVPGILSQQAKLSDQQNELPNWKLTDIFCKRPESKNT